MTTAGRHCFRHPEPVSGSQFSFRFQNPCGWGSYQECGMQGDNGT